MANINIRSYNEVLGDMIRKIIADTPVNDINKGSVLLTLLEAAAANDFENNAAILNTLELLNIDAIRNNDLDAFASNLSLTRNTATKASGSIIVTDSTITKRSTSLYPIKPAPIAGTSSIHVNDASTWDATGVVYIGRGTSNFEGPLSYTSITDNTTFYTINLSSALVNDHLLSETVIDGQGTSDRQVLAGTTVKIPANNINPEIEYTVLRDSTIAAGEDTSDAISVTAVKAGSLSNAGINTITLFGTAPFSGAEVTNTSAFTNGIDTESDDKFRDRIKAYSSSLARGTKRAILAAIDGVSDDTEGKQVSSAVITEPAEIGDASIVYIDDGQGLQPSQAGQSVDSLVASASGTEEFLQLANYPLPRPQAINTTDAPYLFTNGIELKVLVDGVEESVVFTDSDFASTSSATVSEVVVAINNRATSFRCRLSDNSTRLLIYPADERAETLQVTGDNTSADANSLLKFPTNEFSYIKLYQNSTLLKEIERAASLTTTPFSTWGITATGNLILAVDDTPDQDQSFTTSDFGGTAFNALVLSDWVTAFNNKYAGITASETTTGRLIISSNKEGSASKLEVVGGTFLSAMFSGQDTTASGQNSDFALNRQNGNLQIKTTVVTGDKFSAGSEDTKGDLVSGSASGGTFNVSTDASSRPAEMVIVSDAATVVPRAVTLAVGATITITDEGSNVMRIMASTTTAFKSILPDDYIYITNRGHVAGTGAEAWADILSSGLFKIITKGEHLTAGTDSYVEVINVGVIAGGPYTVSDSFDVQAFSSEAYPQLWKGTMATNPAASAIADVVSSINDNIKGVIASIFRTNFIKLTSTTEEGGSIAIPVSVGNAAQLFTTGSGHQEGTQSHIANRTANKDFATIFERTTPVNTNIWLDRYTYTDIKGSVTTAAEPSKDGTGTYSETLVDNATVDFTTDTTYDDAISITDGQNKKQFRDIRTIIDADNLGTRHNTPRSLLDYNVGDEFQVVKNFEFSSEDSIVSILDGDAVAKTVDIAFSRTGQINAGSQGGSFAPTNVALSADDTDNEAGVDFGTLSVWGTLASQSSTDFNDYAMWFRARNWYDSNGAVLILRAKEYGPIGDKIRFTIEHPTIPNATNSFSHTNTPDITLATYTYGSGAAVTTNVAAADEFTVTSLGSFVFRYTLAATATTANITVGDIVNIGADSGFSVANQGVYRISAKNDVARTIDVYNPDGAATVVGNAAIHTVTTVADSGDSLDGTHFTLNAPNGDTVKFWYDNDNSGTVEPAIGSTTRSHEINVVTNDTAIDVATLTAAAIVGDAAFTTATNGGGTLDVITVTNASNGPSAAGANGASSPGFSYALPTPGIADTFETLAIPASFQVYPIASNLTSDLVTAINASEIMVATEHTAGTFIKATREVDSLAVNVLAYDHDIIPANNKNDFVSLWDSRSWVITFQNANPNFQLKSALNLVGVSASYVMDTTPNDDATTGEYFKLVPVTLTNTKHQLTHRALSQMEIVSDVSVANANKSVQIKSEQLGSSGAIEVVGGRANEAAFKIIGDSQITTSGGTNYLELKIPSAPNTFSPGQHVVLENTSGVERLNRQATTDTMDVAKISDTIYEYRYNDKAISLSQHVKFTIVDANSVDAGSYPTAGLVWRWTHNDAGSSVNFLDVSIGAIGTGPALQDAAGSIGSETNLFLTVNDAGSGSTALDFDITSSGQPAQADYITFEDTGGDDYAVWFDIDAAGTVPTGGTYVSATNKVEIDILSTDTPNQILAKLLSQLLTAGIATDFTVSQSASASLSAVSAGDLVNAFGTLTGWDSTNKSFETGDNKVSGYPIVKVDAASKYIDVVNPRGKAMSSTSIGATSTVMINSTPIIEWRLGHSSRIAINTVTIVSNVATATTTGPHGLNVGDTFAGVDIPTAVSPDTSTVATVLGENQFTYASTNADTTAAPAGLLLKTGETRTKYKIESLNYNNLFRLSKASGDSPSFTSLGVAVDDVLILSGTTFQTINSGEFRVLAVDADAIIYENADAVEELDTLVAFNNFDTAVNWVANSSTVTGVAGNFTNLAVGDWVKKTTDSDTFYVQVSAFSTGVASTAISITLASNYPGITSTTTGHSLDQNSDIGAGVFLEDSRDIRILEGDAVRVSDSLFITENISSSWFDTVNSGTFAISALGTNAADGRVFLRVTNTAGIAETAISMGVANTKLSITEAADNKFRTIKKIDHIAIDEFDSEKRIVYLTPGNRAAKWSQSNVSCITALGKMSYSESITTGIDGYLYYTGLLRKVQRIIDGFEPDPVSFPGIKGVGSLIEVLPPLPRRVTVAIDVTTQDGVNLSEISDEITSVIISYVSDLGVGEDVILSDIIVRAKNIDGVTAVTFITPEPTEERIAISSDEKAFIESTDISIA